MIVKPTVRCDAAGYFWLVKGKVRWHAQIDGVPFGPAPGTVVDVVRGPFRSVRAAWESWVSEQMERAVVAP